MGSQSQTPLSRRARGRPGGQASSLLVQGVRVQPLVWSRVPHATQPGQMYLHIYIKFFKMPLEKEKKKYLKGGAGHGVTRLFLLFSSFAPRESILLN